MNAIAVSDDKPRIFVSYSRKDTDFAQELVAGLKIAGFEPYFDKHDIAAGEEWEARLNNLIEQADTVVYIISPDSVASQRCTWEVERTEQLKKRLLPVIWRSVEEALVPERLKRLNYVFFDKPFSFASALGELVVALTTNLDWIRENTRLGELALRWHARGCLPAMLLRGEELSSAKDWLAHQPGHAPEPTLLTLEFLKESEEAELARANAERKQLEEIAMAQKATAEEQNMRARFQRRSASALGCVCALVLAGTIGVLFQVHPAARGCRICEPSFRGGTRGQTRLRLKARHRWTAACRIDPTRGGFRRSAGRASRLRRPVDA